MCAENTINQKLALKPLRFSVGFDIICKFGGIAQLARVLGSYPIGRWFESNCRYQTRSRLNTAKYIFVNGVAGAIFERQ